MKAQGLHDNEDLRRANDPPGRAAEPAKILTPTDPILIIYADITIDS